MAENANAGKQWARVLALGVILAGALFASSQVVQSQQAQPPVGQRPKTARELFVEANECHKRGDYEKAAQLYSQVMKNRLNAADQKDLEGLIQRNNYALQKRSDGAFLLAKAEEFLHQSPPRIKEAEDHWNKANNIQYTDPNLLKMVSQEIKDIKIGGSGTINTPTTPFKGTPKAMLAEGRNAFNRGRVQQNQDLYLKEMEKAMGLAVQAKEAGFPKPIFPWLDNPDKLLNDVKKDLAKPHTFTGDTQPNIPAKKATFLDRLLHREPTPTPPPQDKNTIAPNGKAGGNDGPLLVPVPEPGKEKTGKTESTSPFQSMKNFFGGGSKEKEKNPPDPNVKQVSKDNPEPEHKSPGPGLIKSVFGNKEKSPTASTDGTTPPKDGTATANKPAIEVTGNVSLPPPLPARAPVDAKANTVQARQLIQNGYQSLQAKDYESARRFAVQARDLHPDLEWFEQNPDRLLADIQKREPGGVATGPVITPVKANEPTPTKVATTPAEKDEQAKARAKELVVQGRDLFKKNKLEEADKLCAQAAGIPATKWGLFEDSPEKLRIDIQKARGHRDHEEAARLTSEARDLFKKGQYQEAKTKAWQAQKLHGPYSIWDLGDRPQKILSDIEHAESKQGQDANAKVGEPESKVTPKDNNTIAKGPNNKSDPKGPADSEAKLKARALVAEARALMQQGQLVPAREKAVAALNLRVVFNPGEDSPAAVMQDLGQMCVAHMEGYLKRAGDWMMNPGDPARVPKADADLNAARALAVAFQLDARAIDDRQAQIRQIASNAPVTPPPVQNNLTVANKIGLDKLEKARQELRAGATSTARRIAEDAFDPQYGVQQEAANVLRLIDAEEQNQHVVAALKTMQSGMDAFQHHDYLQARSILAGVDPRLLDPERQRILREILILPEMQEQRVPTMDSKAIASGLKQMSGNGTEAVNGPAGKARVDDMGRPGGDAAFASVRAMEDILFQKFYEESRQAQQKAMAQVKSGETDQAIETLRDYLGQLDRAQLEPERLTLIKKQVEKRMQDYRTLQAQTNIAKAGEILNSAPYSEGQTQKKALKTQDQVVDLMDQYRAFMKEGKYKEAGLALGKAQELDPDNIAVHAARQIVAVQIEMQKHDKIKEVNEKYFLDALDSDQGPVVNSGHPLDYNGERLANIDKYRKNWGNGIPSQNRNPIERDIERKLNRPTSVSFQKTPLSTVVRDLQSLTGVNIVLDKASLDDANVGVDQPLSLSVENISLKCILNLLLREVHLTYVVKNEVLNITTENAAKGGFTQVVYPVSDLITPVEDHPLPDVYDFQKLMAHHIANNGVNMSSASPVQGPFGLPAGQPVGSSSNGLNNPNGFGSGSSNDFARGRRTLEEQLIKLITSTIAPESWESMGGPGKIQYFPLGMSLVIAQQTQDVQEQVQELLAALRRLQDLEVAIEMRLVSVSEAFFEKIGVNFSMNIPTHNSQSIQDQLLRGQFQPAGLINSPFPPSLRGLTTGLTPAGTFTPDLGVPISSGSYAFSNPPFGGFPATAPGGGGIALGLAFLNDIQVAMFMEAAQGDRRTNIMQAPKITVFNGQTASISVNTTQFFLLGVNLSTSPFGQLIMSPQQQPFALGVFLQVTPVVSADRRFVRMNMTPTMTNLVDATVPLIPLQIPVPSTFFGPGNGTTSGQQESIFTMFFQQPSISTITVSTTVNVPDGGTVLLGGLKTLSEGRNEFGPPVLSKIPYISRLFKNVAYGREAQSLMIMVTPRIIINEEEELIFRGVLEPIPRP